MLGVKVKLEQQKLEDGVTVIEAETFEAGSEVFIVMEDEMVPLPIGDYMLQDGRMLVVSEEGKIAEIKEGTKEEAEEEEEMPEDIKDVEQSQERMPKKVIETVTYEQQFKEKTKLEEEAKPEEVVDAVVESEAEVTEEVVAIVEELTPEIVTGKQSQ